MVQTGGVGRVFRVVALAFVLFVAQVALHGLRDPFNSPREDTRQIQWALLR